MATLVVHYTRGSENLLTDAVNCFYVIMKHVNSGLEFCLHISYYSLSHFLHYAPTSIEMCD